MPTVKIIVKDMQANDYSTIVPGVVLRPGSNEVEVCHWLNLRRHVRVQIDNGYLSIDPKQEAEAIESFRSELFAKFELLRVPSVKVAAENGDFSTGALRDYAMQWLLSKAEEREDGRDQRELENLSNSRLALAYAKRANIISVGAAIFSFAAAIIAALIAAKFGK